MTTGMYASLADLEILSPYNPWWRDHRRAFSNVPAFKREVFDSLYDDVKRLPQMLSITGPRRVGKSTLLRQCVQRLIHEAADPAGQARRIAYFSLDDPGLELPGFDADRFFNELVNAAAAASMDGVAYLFLDEVQRFPRWELYLKKFYDLKTPVRFVVSGSASAPIFRKSRESLLGRIKDYHVLPFSFSEWWRCPRPGASHRSPSRLAHGRALRQVGWAKQQFGFESLVLGLGEKTELDVHASEVEQFLFEGGFPEVWALPTLIAKQEYLYQNQVERVIFEDLLVVAEFRKPEMLRRFYLALLKDPGRETNLSQLSKDIELARSTVETYFPLLEATDLVWRLHKHTSARATPKAGNFKTYLVDLAVRNAVMKLTEARMTADPTLMGAYAENVVANHLRRWPGLVELGYWRRNDDELDFVVDLGSERLGVEVKYRQTVQEKDVLKAARLSKQLGCVSCLVVAREGLPFEVMTRLRELAPVPVAVVPLAVFLLLF